MDENKIIDRLIEIIFLFAITAELARFLWKEKKMEVRELLELYMYDDDEVFIFETGEEKQIFKGTITDVPEDIESRFVSGFGFNEFNEFVINV